MPNTKARLLIVDDEPSIRNSLSLVLAEIGYPVRSAEDGLSALLELRNDVPDILITDLNMPGMSGFELLAVVRRRFPSIHTIAMSGAFCGNEVPSGVAADAFYQKGSSVGSLLRMMEAAPRPERMVSRHPAPSDFIWIQPGGQDDREEACATIACPECERTFQLRVGGEGGAIRETGCVHCHAPIRYALAEAAERAPGQGMRSTPRKEKPEDAQQAYC
jgi:CheY-like chemotaxis protein